VRLFTRLALFFPLGLVWLASAPGTAAPPEGRIRTDGSRTGLSSSIIPPDSVTAPAELEALLMEHPAVMDSAVIPKRDAEAGEVPKAFVLVRPGQSVSVEELMRFVEERVAPYKKVREVEFVDAIPKTPSGKILRRELIEAERARGS